jgi:pilus assembly protein CpaD
MEIKIMKTANLTVMIALSLSVAACGTRSNTGVESVHQPVVSRADYVLDVAVDGNSGLSAVDRERLGGWFESLQLRYGDRIAVELPGNFGDGAARASVAALAGQYGLLLDETAPLTTGEVQSGAIRVVVSRMKATVPSCPEWKSAPLYDFHQKTASNFGCAVNSNLAAMVANPTDLIAGQASNGASNVSTSGKAIKTFREAAPTGAGGLKSAKGGDE